LRPWGVGYDASSTGGIVDADVDALVESMIRKYVKQEQQSEWKRRVCEQGDALCTASLLLRSLPHVGRMGFEGFELVDPGWEGERERGR